MTLVDIGKVGHNGKEGHFGACVELSDHFMGDTRLAKRYFEIGKCRKVTLPYLFSYCCCPGFV